MGVLLDEPGKELPEVLVTVALGNGFIVTGMLWGAFLAEMIDRRLTPRSTWASSRSSPSSASFTPLRPTATCTSPGRSTASRGSPTQFALAYLVFGGLFLVLSFTRESREPALPEG